MLKTLEQSQPNKPKINPLEIVSIAEYWKASQEYDALQEEYDKIKARIEQNEPLLNKRLEEFLADFWPWIEKMRKIQKEFEKDMRDIHERFIEARNKLAR